MPNIDEVATKIVEEIISDLSGRSGLGNEWDGIDDNIHKEIKQEWKEIALKELEKLK